MGAAQYMKSFSPSSVNKFIEDKPGFFMERVLKFPFIPNCAMEKGKAVETGVTEMLMGMMGEEQAVAKALDVYDAGTRDMDVEEAAQHRVHIPKLVAAGYEGLAKYGKLLRAQIRVEFGAGWNDTALPWLGFADFEFEDVIVDLKVTGKTPSDLRPGYARQGAFYTAGLGKPTVFAHVVCTPTGKISFVEKGVDDSAGQLRVLTRAAQAIDTALSVPSEQLKALWFPDPGAWQNGDAGTQAKISEVWGF